MQIVIDIPDYDYRQIKEYYEKNDIVEAIYSYIYHGTPLNEVLDKIRAEVEAYQSDAFYSDDVMMNRRMVLEIIDKYRSESDCRECKAEHDCYECEKYTESEES